MEITKMTENEKKLLAYIAVLLGKSTIDIVSKPDDVYGYIYKITNLKNGKVYVGCKMKSTANDGYCCSSSNARFWHSLLKRGPDGFKREVLMWVPNGPNAKEVFKAAEKMFIITENAFHKAGGYNLSFGGNNGEHKVSDETKQKISIANAMVWADETKRAAWCESLKNGHNNEETHQRHVEAGKRQWQDPEIRARNSEGIRQKMNTDEMKQKVSERKKKEWSDPEYKVKFSKSQSEAWKKRRSYSGIRCVEDNLTFSNTREAGAYYGVTHNTILSSVKSGKVIPKINKSFVTY
jgi:group I intron endonuclease